MLGDTIIKHLKGYKMSKKVGEFTVFVKTFGGVKVRYLKDIMKLIMLILLVRKNDLNVFQIR